MVTSTTVAAVDWTTEQGVQQTAPSGYATPLDDVHTTTQSPNTFLQRCPVTEQHVMAGCMLLTTLKSPVYSRAKGQKLTPGTVRLPKQRTPI